MMSKLLLSTIKQPGLGRKIVPFVLGVLGAVEMGMGKLQQGRGSRSVAKEAFASLTQGAICIAAVPLLQICNGAMQQLLQQLCPQDRTAQVCCDSKGQVGTSSQAVIWPREAPGRALGPCA